MDKTSTILKSSGNNTMVSPREPTLISTGNFCSDSDSSPAEDRYWRRFSVVRRFSPITVTRRTEVGEAGANGEPRLRKACATPSMTKFHSLETFPAT